MGSTGHYALGTAAVGCTLILGELKLGSYIEEKNTASLCFSLIIICQCEVNQVAWNGRASDLITTSKH